MHFQRRQDFFDARPRRFEPRRQHQRFTEMRGVFIDREPRAVGGDLEQHAARFLEVDGFEPEAIDDGCRMVTGGFDA